MKVTKHYPDERKVTTIELPALLHRRAMTLVQSNRKRGKPSGTFRELAIRGLELAMKEKA